jgi:hypothetical protein
MGNLVFLICRDFATRSGKDNGHETSQPPRSRAYRARIRGALLLCSVLQSAGGRTGSFYLDWGRDLSGKNHICCCSGQEQQEFATRRRSKTGKADAARHSRAEDACIRRKPGKAGARGHSRPEDFSKHAQEECDARAIELGLPFVCDARPSNVLYRAW